MKLPWRKAPDPYKVRIEEIGEAIRKILLNPRFRREDGALVTNIVPEAVQTMQLESIVLLVAESRTLSGLTRTLKWLTLILTILTAALVLTTLGVKL